MLCLLHHVRLRPLPVVASAYDFGSSEPVSPLIQARSRARHAQLLPPLTFRLHAHRLAPPALAFTFAREGTPRLRRVAWRIAGRPRHAKA